MAKRSTQHHDAANTPPPRADENADDCPPFPPFPRATGIAVGGCGILAILLLAYTTAILLTYDPIAATMADLIANTVLNVLLSIGLVWSARRVRQGRNQWLPLVILGYMVVAGAVGCTVILAQGWTYRASVPVIAIQLAMLPVVIITFVAVIIGSKGK